MPEDRPLEDGLEDGLVTGFAHSVVFFFVCELGFRQKQRSLIRPWP